MPGSYKDRSSRPAHIRYARRTGCCTSTQPNAEGGGGWPRGAAGQVTLGRAPRAAQPGASRASPGPRRVATTARRHRAGLHVPARAPWLARARHAGREAVLRLLDSAEPNPPHTTCSARARAAHASAAAARGHRRAFRLNCCWPGLSPRAGLVCVLGEARSGRLLAERGRVWCARLRGGLLGLGEEAHRFLVMALASAGRGARGRAGGASQADRAIAETSNHAHVRLRRVA